MEVALLGSPSLTEREQATNTGTYTQTCIKLERVASELRSCVEVEVAVLGSPPLIVFMVSVDVKQHCVKVEVAVLGSSPLIVLMVSVDVKQHYTCTLTQGPVC